MKNPWGALPSQPSYVLPGDEEALERARTWPGKYRFHTHLLPEPYFGRPDAPVVLLMSNPGVGASDDRTHQSQAFQQACRLSLVHDASQGPFLHLRTDLNTAGAKYWKDRTARLRNDVGRDIAGDLLVLQLTPYHSREFKRLRPPVPSQGYTVHLLRQALERQAIVVAMRSKGEWTSQVEELKDHPRFFCSSAPRCTFVTPKVLGSECYGQIVAELRSQYPETLTGA